MSSSLRFLVIDDRSDTRLLLVRTLLRKFPSAQVDEWMQESPPPLHMYTAVVAHRARDVHGLELVQAVRAGSSRVPLVLIWNTDEPQLPLAFGANGVLPLEEWLRLGTVVADLLGTRPREDPLSLPDDSAEPEPATE